MPPSWGNNLAIVMPDCPSFEPSAIFNPVKVGLEWAEVCVSILGSSKDPHRGHRFTGRSLAELQ